MNFIKKLFRRLFSASASEKIRDEILSEKIDFDNIVSSSLLAKGLYDELKTACHPDRFQNQKDILKATEFFQLINQHKGNFNKLSSLKEQIYKELPIKKQ